MGAVLERLGFGGEEGGGDAAVKRQAEGFANPMYQLANLMGQVNLKVVNIWVLFATPSLSLQETALIKAMKNRVKIFGDRGAATI